MTDCKSIIEHAAVMQKFFGKLLAYSDEKDMAASAGGGGQTWPLERSERC